MYFKESQNGVERSNRPLMSVDELSKSHVRMSPSWDRAVIEFANQEYALEFDGNLEEYTELLRLVQRAVVVLTDAKQRMDAIKDREMYSDIIKRYGSLEQFKNMVENTLKAPAL